MKIKYLIAALALVIFAHHAHAQTVSPPSGLFWIRENGKWGYIDKTGKCVIPLMYETTYGFNEGLAAVKLNGKYGFIDVKNKLVIAPRYDWTYMFSDGAAMVKIGDAQAFINRQGEQIIAPRKYQDLAAGFSEGRIAFKQNGKWGYMDKQGNFIIPAKYDKATKFNGGMAQVELAGQHIWLDASGREVWKEEPRPSHTTPQPRHN